VPIANPRRTGLAIDSVSLLVIVAERPFAECVRYLQSTTPSCAATICHFPAGEQAAARDWITGGR
jgi:hypothetical protein